MESRVLDLETNQTAEDVYMHHWVVRVDDGDAFYHGIIDWELVARTEDQQSFAFPSEKQRPVGSAARAGRSSGTRPSG